MSSGLKIIKVFAILIILAITLVAAACTLLHPVEKSPLPVSPWGDKYFYKYEPPETRAPGSVKITLAIVSPCFAGKAPIDPIYSKVADGLSKSLAIDLDKIIISKGMTVTGPFENLDMMTYPDKKNADLSLTPEFLINVQTRDITGWRDEGGWFRKTVEVKVDGWVVLMMREPLSSEKIWVKKIEVGEKVEKAEIYAERVPINSKPGVITIPVPWQQYQPGTIKYDGRKDALANIVKKMYPEIMQTSYRYLNTDEILVLKEKAAEIRKLKRY